MSRLADATRGPLALGELADRFGLELQGDPDISIDSVATLAAARPGQLCFLANPAYRDQLESTGASAVIVSPADAARCPCACLVSEDPYAAWAEVVAWLHPSRPPKPGVDPAARVAESARIDPDAEIGPMCVVGEQAMIGAGTILGPACIIEDRVEIGAGARLVAGVYIGSGCRLGDRVLVHPGAVIGGDGFGLAMRDGHWRKVPQLGAVRIGNDCEIGANTTIDRGAIEDTRLGCDVRVDNQVQIAHNVEIGDHTAIAGCVGIAGSTRIGRYCMIAGASGIGGHLEICDRVVITAMSAVLESIDEPGHYGSGMPARPLRAWQRILVRLGQLERLFRRQGR